MTPAGSDRRRIEVPVDPQLGRDFRPSTLIVVDTDGSIKQLDSLSSPYSGAADTDLHDTSGSFDDALGSPDDRGSADRSRRLVAAVPSLRGHGGLRWWPVPTPVPARCRLSQPVRLLRRPAAAHHARPRAGDRGSVHASRVIRRTARSPRSDVIRSPLPASRDAPGRASAHNRVALR